MIHFSTRTALTAMIIEAMTKHRCSRQGEKIDRCCDAGMFAEILTDGLITAIVTGAERCPQLDTLSLHLLLIGWVYHMTKFLLCGPHRID